MKFTFFLINLFIDFLLFHEKFKDQWRFIKFDKVLLTSKRHEKLLKKNKKCTAYSSINKITNQSIMWSYKKTATCLV
jgi:hypothetical protein